MSIVKTEQKSIYLSNQTFDDAQRICKSLCASDLVPREYRGKIENCLIAYELSVRMHLSPIVVMQNLNIVEGRPAWSSKFVISLINSSGRFQPLEWTFEHDDEETVVSYDEWHGPQGQRTKVTKQLSIFNVTCQAYSTNSRGKTIRSPKVSLVMAIQEGWMQKNGSKWKTMPELMLQYRSATFFGNLHCPDVLQGMQTTEELTDISQKASTQDTVDDVIRRMNDFHEAEIVDDEVIEDDPEVDLM